MRGGGMPDGARVRVRRSVIVAYATADGTATAGSDYTARQGKLTFDPGETEKAVRVRVLDDAHDEGAETMRLRHSAASGAAIADGVATGAPACRRCWRTRAAAPATWWWRRRWTG